MDDRQDFADADRGFIAGFPDRKVVSGDGKVVFDRAGMTTAPTMPRRRTR